MNLSNKTFYIYVFAIAAAFFLIINHSQMIYAQESTVIDLDSTAEKEDPGVSVDESFQTSDGHEYQITMNGLKEDNKDEFIQCLSDHYDAKSSNELKIIDDSFSDAEKWDCVEADQYWNDYDHAHCWAASVSNMLWISGWGEQMNNPDTGASFSSEDEIFEYISSRFTDQGGDIFVGIEWFFNGEMFPMGLKTHAGLLEQSDKSDGLLPQISAYKVYENHDLIEDPFAIEKMLDNAQVAGGTIGQVSNDTLDSALHAITVAGIITDPNSDSLENKFKGIVLIDSDNDAYVSKSEKEKDPEFGPDDIFNPAKIAERRAYRAEVKKSRTNSYTVYNLKYRFDSEGTPYWSIEGYNGSDTPYALYSLVTLKKPGDKVIRESLETEGTTDIFTDVDLTLDFVFSTDSNELIITPFSRVIDEIKKEEFESGQPINILYYLANRSRVVLDDKYPSGNKVLIEWKVTRDSDGTVVESGSEIRDFNIYYGEEKPDLLKLNKNHEKWCSGGYTITLNFNTDKAVLESYYQNNVERSVHIVIVGNECTCKESEDNSHSSTAVVIPIQNEKSVPTGTHTDMMLWICLLFTSLMGMFYCITSYEK